jgi:hypothetical protein
MRHASRTAPSVSNVQQPLYVGLLHSEGETPWREFRIRRVVPSAHVVLAAILVLESGRASRALVHFGQCYSK